MSHRHHNVVFVLFMLLVFVILPHPSLACESLPQNKKVINDFVSHYTSQANKLLNNLNNQLTFYKLSLNGDGSVSITETDEYRECLTGDYKLSEEDLSQKDVRRTLDDAGNEHFYLVDVDNDGNEVLSEIDKPNDLSKDNGKLSEEYEDPCDAISGDYTIALTGSMPITTAWGYAVKGSELLNNVSSIPCDMVIDDILCPFFGMSGKCEVLLLYSPSATYSPEEVNSIAVRLFKSVERSMKKRARQRYLKKFPQGSKGNLNKTIDNSSPLENGSDRTSDETSAQDNQGGNFYKSVGEFEKANPDIKSEGNYYKSIGEWEDANLDVNNDGTDDIVSVKKNSGGEELLMDTDGDGHPDMKSITYTDGRQTEYIDLKSEKNDLALTSPNELPSGIADKQQRSRLPQAGPNNNKNADNYFQVRIREPLEQTTSLMKKAEAGFRMSGKDNTASAIGGAGTTLSNIKSAANLLELATSDNPDVGPAVQDLADRAAGYGGLPGFSARPPVDLWSRTYDKLFDNLGDVIENKRSSKGSIFGPTIDWLSGATGIGTASKYIERFNETEHQSWTDLVKEGGLLEGSQQWIWNDLMRDKK